MWIVDLSLGAVLRAIANQLGENALDWGWNDDPLEDIVMGTRGRKRRVDEDFKAAAIAHVYKNGGVPNLGALLRGNRRLPPSTSWGIEEARLRQYQASCFRECQDLEVLSVVCDGSKLGQLPEETEMYAAWDCVKDHAFILLPKVPRSEHVR